MQSVFTILTNLLVSKGYFVKSLFVIILAALAIDYWNQLVSHQFQEDVLQQTHEHEITGAKNWY